VGIMWISFAHTTDAVIMERKTETRRDWVISHVKKFWADQVVDFWNKNPRNGGLKMGSITLAKAPYLENTRHLAYPEDYEAEGFAFMEECGIQMAGMPPLIFFQRWKAEKVLLYVVEFRLHLLTEAGSRRKSELQGTVSHDQVDLLGNEVKHEGK